MTEPKALSQEQRVELVAKAKAELADNMHALAWKFLDYRLAPHDDFYHFAAVDSWRSAERYRIVVDALSALTVERDEALERVKVLEAGLADASLGLQAIAEFWNRHADYMDVMSALHRMIDRATTTRESRALLTPKDPGHG